jgi:hypothetical protein
MRRKRRHSMTRWKRNWCGCGCFWGWDEGAGGGLDRLFARE